MFGYCCQNQANMQMLKDRIRTNMCIQNANAKKHTNKYQIHK